MSARMKSAIWLVVVTALAVGSGCARPDWIEQTLVTVDVTGVWRGEYSGGGTAAAGFFLELKLQQNGPKVTGQLTHGNCNCPRDDGPIEGTVSGDIFSFRSNRGRITGKLQVDGDEMTGPGTGAGQGGSAITLTLRRQP